MDEAYPQLDVIAVGASRRRGDRLRRRVGPAGRARAWRGDRGLDRRGADARFAGGGSSPRRGPPRRQRVGSGGPRDARSAEPPAFRHVGRAVRAGEGVSPLPAAAGPRPGRRHAVGLARSCPGGVDYGGRGVLFAIDEVGRVFRGPESPCGPRVALLLSLRPPACPAHPGSFVVDIGAVLEKKMAAVACYESQFPPEKAERLDFIRVLRGSRGRPRDCAGEVFGQSGRLGSAT